MPRDKNGERWVPEQATHEMAVASAYRLLTEIERAADQIDSGTLIHAAANIFDEMLAAAPAYEPSEADVEKTTRGFCRGMGIDPDGSVYQKIDGVFHERKAWERWADGARAAIAAFLEGGSDGK